MREASTFTISATISVADRSKFIWVRMFDGVRVHDYKVDFKPIFELNDDLKLAKMIIDIIDDLYNDQPSRITIDSNQLVPYFKDMGYQTHYASKHSDLMKGVRGYGRYR